MWFKTYADRHITGWGLHQVHRRWMTNNLLKLNHDKTELIIITTSETTSRQEDIVINIGDSPIAPSMEPPRNLVVLFDSTCCLNDHVNKICQTINYLLHSIGKIRKYFDKPKTEKNEQFGSDIPFGLLQQPSVWYQWLLSGSATTLPE